MPRAAALPVKPILASHVSDLRFFFLGLAGTRRAGVIPAYGGFERCDPDYAVNRDGFHLCALELVTEGEGTVWLDGVKHPLRAGSLFHYDPATPHEIRNDPARPMAKYFLCLAGDRVPARLRAAAIRPGTCLQLAMFIEVQRLWDELIREGGHHRRTSERLCIALTEALLLKIEELTEITLLPGRAEEETFLRCKNIIETKAATLGTLTDITQAVGVGPTRLSRLFRRYLGRSPYQYLLHRKMALAAEMLMNPAALVKEAAARVGFADPYHFSRCFKQVHRVAPKIFQRSLKHLDPP